MIGKIKPTATIVAQFAAGVEVEAIQHEGKMFLPVIGLGEFASREEAPAKPSKKSEPSPSEPEDETASPTSYTKDELMEMDSKELVKILKKDFGIDPNDHEGKNTNKKLRDLILEAQENGSEGESEEDEEEGAEEKAPAKKKKKEEDSDDEEEGSVAEQVGDILEDFDAGKKNKKKTIQAILALSPDANKDKITELVESFEDDGDADIDAIAEKIADVLAGKPSKKKSGKPAKKEKEELVDPEDLEKGDKVSVWWDDENQAWYNGEVKSVKKGKIVITYDDDTEDAIDPEIHTKIKRILD